MNQSSVMDHQEHLLGLHGGNMGRRKNDRENINHQYRLFKRAVWKTQAKVINAACQ
jgi:hypothetical protein